MNGRPGYLRWGLTLLAATVAAMASTILVVDDSEPVREMLRMVLRSLGHEVVAAAGTGVLVALQTRINGELGQRLGDGLLAAAEGKGRAGGHADGEEERDV